MTRAFSPSDIWQRTGVTEHLGGINATQRLLEMCGARGSQRALDIGCGSGYTACRLASDYVAQVSALDISRRSVEDTSKRVAKAGLGNRVSVVQADAHHLPFRPSLFDIVVAESALIFCDVQQVLGEMARVLQPGGVLGMNELTLLRPPPERLNTLLRDSFRLQPFRQAEWEELLASAGFRQMVSVVNRIDPWAQVVSHVRVDGVRTYLSAVVTELADPTLRRMFMSRDMLEAARLFMPYVGYGLYVARR